MDAEDKEITLMTGIKSITAPFEKQIALDSSLGSIVWNLKDAKCHEKVRVIAEHITFQPNLHPESL